jgi:ATP phosphoribosyltransferase
MLKIALPNKGRLAEEVRELFADAGLMVRSPTERALVASLGGEFQAIFVRAQDIPEFVADGAADAGVTGWDLVCESQRSLEMLLDLEFGACRLVVAAREESGITSLDDIVGCPRVATSFPRLAERFFREAGRPVTLVPVSGAAEIAPHLGIADIVVDLTSTGSTLRVHNLHEVATILESSARLIAGGSGDGQTGGDSGPAGHTGQQAATRPDQVDGPAARPGGGRDPSERHKGRALDELSAALASVLRARGQRYVMANVPRDMLERVKAVLPGLNGPTVVDILDGGRHVAVHAVVSQGAIYRTIADLKALGAEGILVTRIERLMP